VALLHGSTVVALDDEPVGTVSALLTDADRRLTHLVISQGMVRPRSKLIPLNWTVAFEDNRVVLAVAAPVVARLPDYYEE
jgi:hypothetical protein